MSYVEIYTWKYIRNVVKIYKDPAVGKWTMRNWTSTKVVSFPSFIGYFVPPIKPL